MTSYTNIITATIMGISFFLGWGSLWAVPQPKEKMSLGVIPASRDSAGKLPSDLLRQLFQDYQAQNFETATKITTGKMGKAITNLYKIQQSYGGQLPVDMVDFFKQLVDMKVVAEYQYKDQSVVRIFWVLHLPEKYNKKLFFTKIQSIDYFLTQDSTTKEWKIADAKFIKEHIINNPPPQL